MEFQSLAVCSCAACVGALEDPQFFGDGLGGLSGSKPVWSLDQVVATLTRWDARWAPGAVPYTFYDARPAHLAGNPDWQGFVSFTPEQREAARLAMELIADVASLSFVQRADDGTVPSSANPRLTFSTSLSTPQFFTGYALVAFAETFELGDAHRITSGELMLNAHRWNGSMAPGQRPFLVLLHEILHAVGLPHPSVYNRLPNEEITYAKHAVFAQDTVQFTVMSYFSAAETGSTHVGFAQSPLLHDVAALQALYGANTATRAGDTVYGYGSTAGRPVFDFAQNTRPILTIWDGGGTDLLDFSQTDTAVRVDLSPGGFSDAFGMTNNISIAHGAWIENARGGAGDDLLSGNAAGNRLSGGTGRDAILGGDGADRLEGEDGDDLLRGDAGDDLVDGGSGADELFGDAGDDVVIGWLDEDRLHGGAGDDFLMGQQGDDHLDGAGGRDRLHGDEGDDLILGGAEGDVVEGGDGDDLVGGQDGDDLVNGGAGRDRLYGDAGADLIVGGADDDFIDGGGEDDLFGGQDGADLIVGGSGRDRLYGDAGDDLIGGQDGDDFVDGGAGRDELYGDAGRDIVVGGSDNDRLFGQDGDDLIGGQDGDDFVDGGAGRDELYGDAGRDIVVGGPDNDRLFGQDGDDLIGGQDGDDFVDGGAGRDELYGDAGRDIVVGGADGDRLFGQDGDDLIGGQDGDDVVDGGAGWDELYGDGGDDLIFGGAGDDRIDGGAGLDTAAFAGPRSAYTVMQGAGFITVTGADGADTLWSVERLQFTDETVFASPAPDAWVV